MTKDVQVLEAATTEVVSSPALTTKQKVLLGGAILATGGLVVFGIFVFRKVRAARAAKANAEPAQEQAEEPNA